MMKTDSCAAGKMAKCFDFSLTDNEEVCRSADDTLFNKSNTRHDDLVYDHNIIFDSNATMDAGCNGGEILNPFYTDDDTMVDYEIMTHNDHTNDLVAEAILSMEPLNRDEFASSRAYDKETYQREAHEQLIKFNERFDRQPIDEELMDEFNLQNDFDVGDEMAEWDEEMAWLNFDEILNGSSKTGVTDIDGSYDVVEENHSLDGMYGCSEVTSSSSPESRQRRKYRRCRGRKMRRNIRDQANLRERNRMGIINDAFEKLRKNVPTYSVERKLSKVETLRAAMDYIKFLSNLLKSSSHKSSSRPKTRILVRKSVPDTECSDSDKVIGYSMSWAWKEGREPTREEYGDHVVCSYPKDRNKIRTINAPLWMPETSSLDLYQCFQEKQSPKETNQSTMVPLQLTSEHGRCFNFTGKVSFVPCSSLPQQPVPQKSKSCDDFYVNAITDLLSQNDNSDRPPRQKFEERLENILYAKAPTITHRSSDETIDVKSKLSGYIHSRLRTKITTTT